MKSHASKHTGSRFYFNKLIYKDFIRCYLDGPHERERDNHLLAVSGSHLRPQTPGWQKQWQLPLPEMCCEQPQLTRKGLFRLSVSQSLIWDWYWRISFCYHLPHTLARGHQLPISHVKCLHTRPVSSKPEGTMSCQLLSGPRIPLSTLSLITGKTERRKEGNGKALVIIQVWKLYNTKFLEEYLVVSKNIYANCLCFFTSVVSLSRYHLPHLSFPFPYLHFPSPATPFHKSQTSNWRKCARIRGHHDEVYGTC